MDSVLISSPVGEKEIKRGDGSGTRGEGRGGEASRLLLRPSAFFAGPPSLILCCESFARGQDEV